MTMSTIISQAEVDLIKRLDRIRQDHDAKMAEIAREYAEKRTRIDEEHRVKIKEINADHAKSMRIAHSFLGGGIAVVLSCLGYLGWDAWHDPIGLQRDRGQVTVTCQFGELKVQSLVEGNRVHVVCVGGHR